MFMVVCTQDDKDFILYKNDIDNKKVRFKIQVIFSKWWPIFLKHSSKLNIRDVVLDNVDRMINCKTGNLGFTVFKCPECNSTINVACTCKSRICSSCGNKYNEQRSTSLFSKIFKWKHRHVVFTIPKELRRLFREDRNRLNYLFDASSLTIKWWFKVKYKKQKLIPAYISVIHTFGRSLVFNPHIHMILMDGGVSNIDKTFVKVDFFSYASFRKRFMKILLDMLENDIGKQKFRKLKNEMYLNHKEGFYVYAPPNIFKSLTELIKYVCRYVARPVMAESRILGYDGTYVTFWYQRHEDDKIVIEKIHALEFISRLIIHIPNKSFRQIRYYGLYHNSSIIKIDLKKIWSNEYSDFKKKSLNWRTMISLSFNKDVLKCPNCQNIMIYYKSEYP